MKEIWEGKHTIGSYHTDYTWKARQSALYAMLGDEAGNHAKDLGFSYWDMKEKGLAWVLAKMRVDVERYPVYDEEVTIRTWTEGWDGIFAVRGYEMVDGKGELLCKACSHWVVITLEGLQLVRPKDLDFPYRPSRSDYPLTAPLRVPPEGMLIKTQEFTAQHSHVDFLRHVNNAKYADWVCDCFDQSHYDQWEIESLTLNYNQQVVWRETVEVNVYAREADKPTHRFEGVSKTTGKNCFFAEATWRAARDSGL